MDTVSRYQHWTQLESPYEPSFSPQHLSLQGLPFFRLFEAPWCLTNSVESSVGNKAGSTKEGYIVTCSGGVSICGKNTGLHQQICELINVMLDLILHVCISVIQEGFPKQKKYGVRFLRLASKWFCFTRWPTTQEIIYNTYTITPAWLNYFSPFHNCNTIINLIGSNILPKFYPSSLPISS